MKYVGELFGKVVRSRLGWILVSLHAAWFFLATADMTTPSPSVEAFVNSFGGSTTILFAGRPYHWGYQSLALKLLMVLDFPSHLAVALVFTPVAFFLPPGFHPSIHEGSYLMAALVFLGASCQWLLLGNSLHRWLVSGRRRRWVLEQLHRRFTMIVTITLVIALILTPIINERSRIRSADHSKDPVLP
jgi:hypothetical protein